MNVDSPVVSHSNQKKNTFTQKWKQETLRDSVSDKHRAKYQGKDVFVVRFMDSKRHGSRPKKNHPDSESTSDSKDKMSVITQKDPLDAIEIFLSEARQLRQIPPHPRLVQFIGFEPKGLILYMEYMPLGNIKQHLLSKTKEKCIIDWTQKMSFARDIAEGMKYLISLDVMNYSTLASTSQWNPQLYLGRLFLISDNILLAQEHDQIRCKITGYGMTKMNENSPLSLLKKSRMQQNQWSLPHCPDKVAYLAPELYHNHNNSSYTLECDVFAYGILLTEIVTQLNIPASIERVDECLSLLQAPSCIVQAVRETLSLQPHSRPSFAKLFCMFEGNDAEALLNSTPNSPLAMDTPDKDKLKQWDRLTHHSLPSTVIIQRQGIYECSAHVSLLKTKVSSHDYGETKTADTENTHYLPINTRFLPLKNKSISYTFKWIHVLFVFCIITTLCLVLVLVLVFQKSTAATSTTNNSPTRTQVTSALPLIQPTLTPLPEQVPPKLSLDSMWGGVVHSYMFALPSDVQDDLLSFLSAQNVGVVRIFIVQVIRYYMGSESARVPDVEPVDVGVYDDTILRLVDEFMVRVYNHGLKLIISLHDVGSLGEYRKDVYATTFNLKTSDLTPFYARQDIVEAYDRRIQYILKHVNPYFQQPWSELDQVIFGFDLQNKPLKDVRTASFDYVPWLCDRASVIHARVTPGMYVLTSQCGIEKDQVLEGFFKCDHVDIVGFSSTSLTSLDKAIQFAKQYNKTLVVEDYFVDTFKLDSLARFLEVVHSKRVPWILALFGEPGGDDTWEFSKRDVALWNLIQPYVK